MTTLEPRTKQQDVVRKVYEAFFSPAQYEVKPKDREIIEWGNNYRIPYRDGELAVTTWGETSRPAVLLMHGWGGARGFGWLRLRQARRGGRRGHRRL